MKGKYKKVSWEYVIARTFGYPSNAKLIEDGFEMNEYFIKYSKRYHYEKVRSQLMDNWNLFFYSKNMRRFYVGMKESKKSIIRTAMNSSKKYKDAQRKKEIGRLEREVAAELDL